MSRKACFTCVKEGVLAVLCTEEGVFYVSKGEVCVGCTVYQRRCLLPV